MAATLEIRAPAEQTEGTRSQVLRWLKTVGEPVAMNEPLIELETDKVTVEIAAPASGVLREILKREQDEIAPGDLLGLIEPGRAGAATAPAERNAETAETPEIAAVPTLQPAPGSQSAPTVSPAVRRLLTEHGLDASQVPGSGMGGRITVDDVLQFVATRASSNASALANHNTAHELEAPEHIRRVPHTVMRRRVAEHMVQSLLRTSPHVTSVFEADMSAVLAHRTRNQEEFERRGAPLTLTAYFLAAAVDAIRAVPESNSRWTEDALEINDEIHVGIATALGDQGLLVPVMKNVEKRDLSSIASELQSLVRRAREGRLTPADVRGGTFTISNHGVSGSLVATPIIINQPQSSILGIGKLEKRVTVVTENGEDRMVIKPKCYVTLTIDHRVMDGFQTNRFLQTFVNRLETWPTS